MPHIYILNLKSKCCLKQDFKTIKSRHKNLHPLSYFGNFSLDFLWFTLSFFPSGKKRKEKKNFPSSATLVFWSFKALQICCASGIFHIALKCACVFCFFLNLHPKKPKVTGTVIQGGFLHPVKRQATKSLHQHLS